MIHGMKQEKDEVKRDESSPLDDEHADVKEKRGAYYYDDSTNYEVYKSEDDDEALTND
jgi:hypothetical protein